MGAIAKDQTVKISFDISSVRQEEILCKIKEVESDRISLTFPPECMDIARYLIEGNDVEVLIYTDSGIYIFDSIVINSPLDEEFVVELPEASDKIQRRKYVRAPIATRIDVISKTSRIKTTTVNIGGGGMRFYSPRVLPPDSEWDFLLYLPQWDEPIRGTGSILYSVRKDKDTVTIMRFDDILESDRSKIIKVCFEEESFRLKR